MYDIIITICIIFIITMSILHNNIHSIINNYYNCISFIFIINNIISNINSMFNTIYNLI